MNPIKNHARAIAPAKVILFGEHFVVYGKPAILASIDKKVHVDVKIRKDDRIVIKSNIDFAGSFDQKEWRQIQTRPFKSLAQSILTAATDTMNEFNANVGLDISIRSEFQQGVGLGSSAACSVGTIGAVGALFGQLSKKKICDISLNAEKMVHGNPSGADSAICTYGGLMLYTKNKRVKPINSEIDLQLILLNSGIRRTTGKVVSRVEQKHERNNDLFMDLATKSEKITLCGLKALNDQDYKEIGLLMTLNHDLLSRLGVSRVVLDNLVQNALKNGALGAKITGAGGGGCIIVLASKHCKNKIMKLMKRYRGFVAKIEYDGLIVD